MAKTKPISNLGPGDKFFYNDTYYFVVGSLPYNYFLTASVPDPTLVCALDLTTYKVVAFNRDIKVAFICSYRAMSVQTID